MVTIYHIARIHTNVVLDVRYLKIINFESHHTIFITDYFPTSVCPVLIPYLITYKVLQLLHTHTQLNLERYIISLSRTPLN